MRLGALLLLIAAAVLVPAAVAGANTFVVTNTSDSVPAASGSLRKAIEEANANRGKDSILITATGTIDLQSALPEISEELDITGPGQSALAVRRSAAAAFSIFRINSGSSGLRRVSISGMTISNGKAGFGGGMVVSTGGLTLTRVTVAGNEATQSGGGVAVASLSDDPLTLRESSIIGNTVRVPGAVGPLQGIGGGVRSFSDALIDRSTIVGNLVQVANPTGKVEAFGGGVALESGGQNEIRQSTIAGNAILVGSGATELIVQGGGAFVDNTRIVGSTITANAIFATSPGQGANLFGRAPGSTVADTILSNPLGTLSCAGALASEGFNIDDAISCGFTQPTDRSPVDPLLAPALSSNGGRTPNFALLPGSPAIDNGKAFGATTDQRGKSRPSDFSTIANEVGGDGSDIGAFEVQASPPGPPQSARLYLIGNELSLPRVATIKTQSNEVIGEPFPLRSVNANLRPSHAIAITPDGKRAYIANEEGDNVSVIDTATNTELAGSPIEARVTDRLNDIAITPDGARAYVSQRNSSVSVFDTATNTELAGSPIVLPTPAGGRFPEPSAIAITPDGKRAYVADAASDLLFVIDTQTNALVGSPIVLPTPAVGQPEPRSSDIAITPDGARAYVTIINDDAVTVIDTRANTVIGQVLKSGSGGDIYKPTAIAITPDGTRAYIANSSIGPTDRDIRANTLGVIDTQTNLLLTSVPVGKEPSAIAITPDGTRAYVANKASNNVSAIDTKTNQALPGSPIEMGADFNPINLEIVPDQGPTASFSAPATLRLGAPLHPDASASRDPDGTVAAFSWDFGDGAKAQGQSPQHPYAAPGSYDITLTTADNEGCSTARIFTGQTVSCNGTAAAKTSRSVKVVLPAIRVSCPARVKAKGKTKVKVKVKACQLTLQVVTRKRRGKAETKPVKVKLRARKSALVPLQPLPAFIATLGTAQSALVKETVKIGRLKHTRVRRLAIR